MPSTLDLTLGAIEMGAFISAILYGMVCIQVYIYSMGCKSDRAWTKLLVAFVWALETLHVIAMIAYVYTVTVTRVGEESALSEVKWFVVVNMTLSSLVGSPVQAYFTWRSWVVSAHAWYSVPPWIAELARLIVVLVNCVYLSKSSTIEEFKGMHGSLVTMTLATCVAVDMWNSSVLCYHLTRQRTVFERTMSYVNSIILWSAETSLLVCVLAVFSIALWLTKPHSALWLCVLMIHAKIYSNSMLLSLNARIIRKAATARPTTLSRTWELARVRPGQLTSSTQPDSAAIATPLESTGQYAYYSSVYDGKPDTGLHTSPPLFTPVFSPLSAAEQGLGFQPGPTGH